MIERQKQMYRASADRAITRYYREVSENKGVNFVFEVSGDEFAALLYFGKIHDAMRTLSGKSTWITKHGTIVNAVDED